MIASLTWQSRQLRTAVLRALGWLAAVAFLAWAVRLVALEGYLYEIGGNFVGDFTRTAALGAPDWYSGSGLFYGPIFVLESRFLVQTEILSPGDFARLDFVLFGVAFACVWLALFGWRRPALAVFVLAAWLAHHMTVEAFSNTAHLEVLEFALFAVALLLAVRGSSNLAGGALGLAIATKTLPALFLPYLAITRKWRMLAVAAVTAFVLFAAVCWLQGVSLFDGAYQLIYQGGNLAKVETSEYEYTLRAEIARMLAGDGGSLSDDQSHLAASLAWLIGIVVVGFVGWLCARVRIPRSRYGLLFGLIAAVMLVVAPSAHAPYYIFLLIGWTAILAAALAMPFGRRPLAICTGLALAYVFTGFDQVFFAMQRLFGFGIVVPQHWQAWHLPTFGLLLTIGLLALLLREPLEAPAPESVRAEPQTSAQAVLAAETST